MKNKNAIPEKVGDLIISQIIGQKPRMPQSYQMRKQRGTEADIEFCKNVDARIQDWEEKAKIVRAKALEERREEFEKSKNFPIKEEPPIVATEKHIIADFMDNYKRLNKNKPFNKKNPFSDSDEPNTFLYTLVFYFMKDERFFKSPLLRRDLSSPSFDKGTLTIGNYGCGKTSIFRALLHTFKNHVEFVKKKRPSNLSDILEKYDINTCISSDIVNQYNVAHSREAIDELLRPLMSIKPLYIDDITRENNGSNFGVRNIFLDVLTHRADKYSETHLSMNFREKLDADNKVIGFKNTEDSLLYFRSRYDGRVHDRTFGHYNIIELTGKSFRR